MLALAVVAAVSLQLVSNASAQQAQSTGQETQKPAPAPQVHTPPGMRTLTLQEGRAIVQKMAWADDEEGLSPDCSHLVHTLYERAGYPYTYVSSLDLYRGADAFVRVRAAHPGDLIVWRGHVGIVVNPKEHTFFSSESVGARIGHYDSVYWRGRGYARFYRYLTSRPAPGGGPTLQTANRPPEREPRVGASSGEAENRLTKAQKLQTDGRGAAAQTSLQASSGNTSSQPGLQAVKTLDPALVSKSRAEAVPAAGSKPGVESAHPDLALGGAIRTDNSLQIPLQTGVRAPKAADVTSALQAANLDAGEILRDGDLWQLERPVVVYRDLRVAGVEVKGRKGTARVQLETVAALSAKRMETQKGWEEHQLDLQQSQKGWVMILANGSAYVPRTAALRILAARLAVLTQTAETSAEKEREQAEIIRFMNLLVE